MDVRCRKTKCQYNNNQTCTYKNLQVGERTECKDFNPDKTKYVENYTATLFEKPPKIAPFKNIHKYNLKCDATSCIFNHNNECLSNGITMLSLEKGTECLNYFEK